MPAPRDVAEAPMRESLVVSLIVPGLEGAPSVYGKCVSAAMSAGAGSWEAPRLPLAQAQAPPQTNWSEFVEVEGSSCHLALQHLQPFRRGGSASSQEYLEQIGL